MESRELQLAFELALASEQLRLFRDVMRSMVDQIAEMGRAADRFAELLEKLNRGEKGERNAD